MHDLVFTSRNAGRNGFGTNPGPTRYLAVPPDAGVHLPAHAIARSDWVQQVFDRAGSPGNLIVLVHGYFTTLAEVMARHRRLAADLAAQGVPGLVVSYDWPCAANALNYLEDRHDAKKTALALVDDGIRLLARLQRPDCTVGVHLVGHSTGAYVIREAFDDADDCSLTRQDWTVASVVFIGGDVSAGSMDADSGSAESLYRHALQVVNYSSHGDWVLGISNAKRLGVAARVGRVGLNDPLHPRASNVDCTDYVASLDDPAHAQADQIATIGVACHSWHIGNRIFTADLAEVIRGRTGLDFPQRTATGPRRFRLRR